MIILYSLYLEIIQTLLFIEIVFQLSLFYNVQCLNIGSDSSLINIDYYKILTNI